MINRCDDCKHSKVCLYKQRYQEKYMTLKNELKPDEPFEIELKCKEYEHNATTVNVKDFEVGIRPLTINPCDIRPSTKNPCDGCSIYEDIKKGNIVITDACNFCSRSPIKIGN